MSGSVRVRRQPSPAGRLSQPPTTSQRFPHSKHDHLDADQRREAASRGLRPGRRSHVTGGLDLSPGEWKLLVVILIVASAVRLFRISQPTSVVFDEVHFGKFASKYIKSSYFVDVHPPLAKLLITLAGWLFGYDGNFDFKDIAKPYENVPYVAMRMLPAIMGIATVPLAYLTLRALDCRVTTSLLASLFITFENGLITQSRHVLLDSPLIFFTALTTFAWTAFCNEDRYEPFTDNWWIWLSMTGLSLGAVVSCKWVGLFTIATVGLGTLKQLWELLGDIRVPPKLFIKHFFARAICLIIIPSIFYMSIFGIHFAILSNSGEGDGFMSSEFQHTLRGRGMEDTFADVAFGSQITIRHVNTQGGYLHSHAHPYPGGSKQQQVTLYPHRDSNNDWRIVNATQSGDPYTDWANHDIAYIKSGSRVKIRHITTEKSLHSHDHRPPVSDVDFQQEVSGYGIPDYVGDSNDDWIVEIYKGQRRDKDSGKRLKTLRTKFRLRHAQSGCYLFSHKVKLPEWGFEQQEVTCNKQAVLDNSLWYIETNYHHLLPKDAPKVNYRLPGFFAKFWELQGVMWTTNAGLTDRHTYDSRPDAWPRLRRGINFWVKDHRQIYLLGNPLVWYLSSAGVFAYVAVRGLLILRAKRSFRDFENTKVVKYDAICGFLFVGWALHYAPFFLMQRQLFLHHYFPALYFAILLSCAGFDLVTHTLRPRVRLQIAAVLLVIAVWNYSYFSPLAYGLPWTKAKCHKAQWMKTWDFSCNDFLDDYSGYKGTIVATPQISSPPVPANLNENQNPGPGRGAVPIGNPIKIEHPEDKPDTTSTIAFGQAEPGIDIFADHPHNEIKSVGVGFQQVQNEQQEISSASSVTEAVKVAEPATQSAESVVPADSSSSSEESSSSTSSSSEDSSSPAGTSTHDQDHVEVSKAEDEAEADRARHILFPDSK